MKLSMGTMEALSIALAPLVWFVFKKTTGRNVFGSLLAGCALGLFNEFATAPLWTYHYRLRILNGVPVAVVLSWGVMFTLVTALSEVFYRRWTRGPVQPADPRILGCDVLAGVLVGLPMEMIGLRAGVWQYNMAILGWHWGNIPVIDMPYEALVGYALFMLIGPSYVRRWSAIGQRTRTV